MNIINILVMFMLLFLSSCALNKLFDYYKLGTHKYLIQAELPTMKKSGKM